MASNARFIERKRITMPSSKGGDGLPLCDGQYWVIRDSIVDLSACPLCLIDEAAGITWGSSALFENCVIRGAGKLVLCGCGDKAHVAEETGKSVTFIHCILEDAARRLPEVQDGMHAILQGCLVRNWGEPERFNYDPEHPDRAFGAWAHGGGSLSAVGCVFWQDGFARPWGQFWRDIAHHVGQAVNDEGLLALLNPRTYMPGVCRGLTASAGGYASAQRCWANKWWISLGQNAAAGMTRAEAFELIADLEEMADRLERELPYAA